VALARCLVTEPRLVLLDEPLANLDVQLRAAMEREFRDFHDRTGTTMIYITHDQTEAMALADRIAVMDKGRVLQFATPSQLYREPADATVGKFIGEGMIVPVRVVAVHADATCDADVFGYRLRMRCSSAQTTVVAAACLRASALSVVAPSAPGFRARVLGTTYQGGHFRLEVCAEADPEVPLHLYVPEPCALSAGTRIDLAVADGWVIPGGTA
jgi:iron(III) transport system ATP-binding protein